MDNDKNVEICEIIIQQLGGYNKLKAMVGASNYNFGTIKYKEYEQPCVLFKFKMNPKIKSLRVIYDEGKDLYAMQFLGRTGKIHKEIDDVFCDELVKNFEETTGLLLRLF